ncbi:MAG: 2OG-Fe(II) oxygenase [Mariniblastus sp.]
MRSETWLNDYVFTVEQFLSNEECSKYIEISEDTGFEEALVTTAKGTVRMSGVRNNDRVMFKSQEIADWLWERAEDFVPSEMEGRQAVGVNELIRFYRYDADQQFNWHQDMPYERDNGEKSFLTLIVYLNERFSGGETSFDDSYSPESFDEFMVVPENGLAVFFEHETHHKGEPVLEGRKYVMRSDVMYAALEDDDEDDPYFEDENDDVDNW